MAWGISMRRAALAEASAALSSAAAATLQQPELAGAAAAAAAGPPLRQRCLPLGVTDPTRALAAYGALRECAAALGEPPARPAAPGARAARPELSLRLVGRRAELRGDDVVVAADVAPALAWGGGGDDGGGGGGGPGSQQQPAWDGAALRVTHASMAAWEARAPLAARSAWAWDAAAGVLTVEAAVGLQQLLPLAAAGGPRSQQQPQQQQQQQQQEQGEQQRSAALGGGGAATAEAEEGNPYLEVADALAEAALGPGAGGGDYAGGSESDGSGGGGESGGGAVLELCVVVSAEPLPALLPPGATAAGLAATGVLLLEPLRLPLGEWAAWWLGGPAAGAPRPRLAYDMPVAGDSSGAAKGAPPPSEEQALAGGTEQRHPQDGGWRQGGGEAAAAEEEDDGDEEALVIEESEVSDSSHPVTLTQPPRLSAQPPSQAAAAAAAPAAHGEAESRPQWEARAGREADGPASSSGRRAAAAAPRCLLQRRHLLLRAAHGGALLAQLPAVLVRDLGFRPEAEGAEPGRPPPASGALEAACAAAAAGGHARVLLRHGAAAEGAAIELLLHGGAAAEAVLQADGVSGVSLDVLEAALQRGVELLERAHRRQWQQEAAAEEASGRGAGGVRVEPNPASRDALAACAAALDALDDALLLQARAVEGALRGSGGGAASAAAAGPRGGGGHSDAAAARDQRQQALAPAHKRGAPEGGGAGALQLLPCGDAAQDALWLAWLQAQADLDAAVCELAAAAAPV
jgi:hypothetical protein